VKQGTSPPVQALDGIGAGLQSIAVPGLVARILNGTGKPADDDVVPLPATA
jgi:hypothetical protein